MSEAGRSKFQNHLALDFPIKSPASAKALTEELPPLMPDFAKTQDEMGTVHFSRFMVKGDEKLLFLSDIDGEIDEHIKRLVESAGPVFDAIFKHVEDPPATPVASNPREGHQMAEASYPRAYRYLFRLRGRFGSGDQGGRSCGGLYGQHPQSTLLTYMAFKSRLQGFVLKTIGPTLIGEKAYKASDSIGTLHVVPFCAL